MYILWMHQATTKMIWKETYSKNTINISKIESKIFNLQGVRETSEKTKTGYKWKTKIRMHTEP